MLTWLNINSVALHILFKMNIVKYIFMRTYSKYFQTQYIYKYVQIKTQYIVHHMSKIYCYPWYFLKGIVLLFKRVHTTQTGSVHIVPSTGLQKWSKLCLTQQFCAPFCGDLTGKRNPSEGHLTGQPLCRFISLFIVRYGFCVMLVFVLKPVMPVFLHASFSNLF